MDIQNPEMPVVDELLYTIEMFEQACFFPTEKFVDELKAIALKLKCEARSVFGQKPTIQKEKKLFNEYWYENNLPFDGEEVFKKYAWDAWQAAKAQAVPEGFVLVPKLSANYLFNKVPELSFKHQDEKDTVLYHLNYMASEFKESAKQFVLLDHEKQKSFIEESGLAPYRTDFEIIEQTLKLVDLLASSTNVFQRDPKSKVYPFESENPRVVEWWRTACKIQELLTDTDPENCDFEEYKAIIEAQEQGHE